MGSKEKASNRERASERRLSLDEECADHVSPDDQVEFGRMLQAILRPGSDVGTIIMLNVTHLARELPRTYKEELSNLGIQLATIDGQGDSLGRNANEEAS